MTILPNPSNSDILIAMPAGKVMTITELTSIIKDVLEGAFPVVEVEGEVSNLKPASSGHVYFTLKDSKSAIGAVMFKSKANALSFKPKDGDMVRVAGSLSVYGARGTYQIIVEAMEMAGEGEILKMLEERKRRLAAEGLFDESRKRKPTDFPRTVAVITSPTGAAVRDILQVLSRRNPAVSVVILPAKVQGEGAAEELCCQLKTANRFNMADTIIIGRGGGSIEDLLAFSDEAVVREVAASSIPVISAVGHEIDWALCDFAADKRAPTPSAAAELASRPLSEIVNIIEDAEQTFIGQIGRYIESARSKAAIFSVDNMEMWLSRIVSPAMQDFDRLKDELVNAIKGRAEAARHAFMLQKECLKSCDPQAVLARGYSIVKNAGTGAVVTDAAALKAGDILEITPSKGKVTAEVREVSS